MSRKFIVSLAGLIVSIVALCYNNTLVALGGLILAGCFVIGESIVDAHSCVKREHSVSETHYVDSDYLKEKNVGKAEA